MRGLLARLKGVFVRRRLDARLDDEVEFHLAMLADEYVRRGLTPADARAAARREFGGVMQLKEAWRDQRGLPLVDTLAQDVRYAVRALRRTPGFTAAALLTLALGIGGNTAIFSIVNAVVLQPLPFPGSDRLVMFGDRDSAGQPGNVGFATLHDIRDRATTLDRVVAVRGWSPTLVVNGEAERLDAMRVSWDYFDMLGVRPAVGRGFSADDDRPDRWRVLLISDGLWRRRFGADPDIVGRSLRMNGRDYHIVGVLPAAFEPIVSARFYRRAEMWAPLGYAPGEPSSCRTCRHLKAVGRLREGVSVDSARAELDAIRMDLARAHPRDYASAEIAVVRLRDLVAGPVRPTLLALLGAVGLVLLIACANVANLLIARSLYRSRELAIRAALGAGRKRLVRQLLTESVLLGLAGGLLGLVLAGLSLEALLAMAPVTIPRLDRVSVDGAVLAFALLLSAVTGVAFGLLPARHAASRDLREVLAAGARGAGAPRQRIRRLLVVGDLALAMVLLVSAGLMIRSVGRLMHVEPGFDAHNVLTLRFSLVGPAYAEDAAVDQFIEQVLERTRALPGVEAAAITGQIPMGGDYDQRGFHIEGRATDAAAESPSVERYSVTPDYFHVMGIPLLRGRLPNAADRADSLPIVVVGEATARRLWPGADPIGDRVRIGSADEGPWRTIVGVVGDVRHFRLDEAPTLQMYLPQSQLTDSFVVLAVRTAIDMPRLLPALRGVVRELDPSVPVYEAASMRDLVELTAANRRFAMRLLGIFAALALLLAAVGLYGLVAYTVGQRTREIGVRVALGATRLQILVDVLSSGMATLAIGLGCGIAGALVAARFIEKMLFGVTTYDFASLAGAVLALSAVAVLAHLVPARRALSIDPSIALRQD